MMNQSSIKYIDPRFRQLGGLHIYIPNPHQSIQTCRFFWDLLRPVCAPTTLLGFGEERILWLDGLVWNKFEPKRVAEKSLLFYDYIKYLKSWSECHICLDSWWQIQWSSKPSKVHCPLQCWHFLNWWPFQIWTECAGRCGRCGSFWEVTMHIDFWAWNTWKADCQERFQPVKVLLPEQTHVKVHLSALHFEFFFFLRSSVKVPPWRSFLWSLWFSAHSWWSGSYGIFIIFCAEKDFGFASCFSKWQVYLVFFFSSVSSRQVYLLASLRKVWWKRADCGRTSDLLCDGVGPHWHEFHTCFPFDSL